jgi:hypothetical protein
MQSPQLRAQRTCRPAAARLGKEVVQRSVKGREAQRGAPGVLRQLQRLKGLRAAAPGLTLSGLCRGPEDAGSMVHGWCTLRSYVLMGTVG